MKGALHMKISKLAILALAIAACLSISGNLHAAGLYPINWGFECCPTSCNGSPTSYGYWSYDWVPPVEAENGIVPYEGSHMGKFVYTQNCSEGAWYSEIYQLLDISFMPPVFSDGMGFISAECWVNRVAGDSETDTAFKLIVYACSGLPSQFNPTAAPLDSLAAWIFSDANPGTWEHLAINGFLVPAGTSYLAIGVMAFENVSKNDSPEFDGHYVDDVRVNYGHPLATAESSWGAIKGLFKD